MKQVTYFKVTIEGNTEQPNVKALLKSWIKQQSEHNFSLVTTTFTATDVEILGSTTLQNTITGNEVPIQKAKA